MLNFCEKREKKVQKNSKVKMTKLSKISAGVPCALPIFIYRIAPQGRNFSEKRVENQYILHRIAPQGRNFIFDLVYI